MNRDGRTKFNWYHGSVPQSNIEFFGCLQTCVMCYLLSGRSVQYDLPSSTCATPPAAPANKSFAVRSQLAFSASISAMLPRPTQLNTTVDYHVFSSHLGRDREETKFYVNGSRPGQRLDEVLGVDPLHWHRIFSARSISVPP